MPIDEAWYLPMANQPAATSPQGGKLPLIDDVFRVRGGIGLLAERRDGSSPTRTAAHARP